MYLQVLKNEKLHISELYTLAFVNNPVELTEIELRDYIEESLEIAKDTCQFQLIDMNNNLFILIVYPSGIISLYKKEDDYVQEIK